MKNPKPLITALVAVFVLGNTGCLTRIINKHWPPKEPADNQIEAIANAKKQLENIPRVDVHVSVGASILKKFLSPALEQAVPGIKVVDVSTKLQEVVATIDFDKEFTHPQGGQVRLAGRATVNAALFVQNDDLVAVPSFSTVKLTKIKIIHTLPSPIDAAINLLLSIFLNNINGALQQQHVRLDLKILQTLDPKGLLQSPPFRDIVGQPIIFDIALDRAAVLVDNSSVHVLGKFKQESLPPASSETPVAETAADKDVESAFSTYQQAFNALSARDLGSYAANSANSTGAAISKKFLSQVINTTLDKVGDSAGIDLPPAQINFGPQSLQFDPAPDLQCAASAAKKSCDINMSCDQSRDCNPNWACPDCGGWPPDPSCPIRKLGCEADKARYRGQCEAEKSAARAGCEVNKAQLKAQCEFDKAAQKLGCDINQGWLNDWGGKEFGNVSGRATMNAIGGRVAISKVAVQDDLSSMIVNSSVQAEANFEASFQFQPLNAGYLACQVPWGGDVNFAVGMPEQALQLSAAVNTVPNVDSKLDLQFVTGAQPLTLKASPPPIVALLAQNGPTFVISCLPVVAAGATLLPFSQKLREDLIQDSFNYTLSPQRFVVTIQPINVDVPNGRLSLAPNFAERYIDFELLTVP